ncbi:unnamed protein product [Brassica rapa]|uniref:UEV domain-containing protein n=2 Tax=Brassica campestris TaxID=3711 RepID=A0A8D9HYC8_BRACM|nr:unnamed protein product [Brassica rapa]
MDYTGNKLERHNLEAEKRLKKVKQDYLHTSQKYIESDSQLQSLYNERRRADSLCSSAEAFTDWCNNLVKKLHEALDKIPTTEETIDHSLQFSMSNSVERLEDEQCQKLDSEAIRDFREVSRELYYIQRKMPRSESRRSIQGLLNEVKEKNKCKDKAVLTCTLVYNPRSCDNLRKSVELEIKVLKKLIREIQKDWEDKLQIRQCARDLYSDSKRKVKHLWKKKDHLSGQWDEEKKHMLGNKEKHERRIGAYPEAEYIKMQRTNPSLASMASSSSSSPLKFIEKALLATGPFALSYTDPDQKWVIRKHLTSFLQDFSNFDLSTDTFNHNNGTTVQLFRLDGSLRTPQQSTAVQLTIWVHENYPLTPPLVFVIPPDSMTPVRTNHPFVSSSGFTNSNYIETWEYPPCNLLNFVRNLRRVLANDHPFVQTDSIPTKTRSVSRPEALDRLVTSLHYDVLAIMSRSEEEIESLWRLQTEVKQRSESVRTIISDLETERETLKENVLKLEEDTDVLAIWVERNYPKLMKATSKDVGVEEMFEMEEEKKLLVESLAADKAIEDVLCNLEEASRRGEMEIGSYLKHVRVLAREQFFSRHHHLYM